MRDRQDPSHVDVVYRSPHTTNPIYHTDRECRQLADADAVPVARSEVPDRYRECERCRYDDVPTLEAADAGPSGVDRARVEPFILGHLLVALSAVLIVLGLFVGVVGGLL
jgi:hypothetical protein